MLPAIDVLCAVGTLLGQLFGETNKASRGEPRQQKNDNLGHISILIPANSKIVNISISAFFTFPSEKIFPSLDLQNAFDLES